jgi:hypothetical protein
VNGCVVCWRQTGRCGFKEVFSSAEVKEDGRQHLAVRGLFDHEDDVAKNIPQGSANGNSRENVVLGDKQIGKDGGHADVSRAVPGRKPRSVGQRQKLTRPC